MNKKIYLAEDLFKEIPNDPENVIFQIPPEICEQAGWKEGDSINIKVENNSLILTKVST